MASKKSKKSKPEEIVEESVAEEAVEEAVEETVEETDIVEKTRNDLEGFKPTSEEEEAEVEGKSIPGEVIGCVGLRLRRRPLPTDKTETLTIIPKGDGVMVNLSLSTKTYYHCTVNPGPLEMVGFCDRKYIQLEK